MSLRIFPVLCNKGFMDNYSYIIEDEETKTAAINQRLIILLPGAAPEAAFFSSGYLLRFEVWNKSGSHTA